MLSSSAQESKKEGEDLYSRDEGYESAGSYDGDVQTRDYTKIELHNRRFRIDGYLLRKKTEIKIPFEKTLREISDLFSHHFPYKKITCFLSYAWPEEKLKEKESWIKKLVSRLGYWFEIAGLEAHWDTGKSRAGANMRAFMEKAKTDDFAILFCTESRVHKLSKGFGHAVGLEENYFKKRFSEDEDRGRSERVIPVLMSGSFDKGVESDLPGYISVGNAKEFFFSLPKLLQYLISIMFERFIKEDLKKPELTVKTFMAKYNLIWKSFFDSLASFKTKISEEDIKKIEENERAVKCKQQKEAGEFYLNAHREALEGSAACSAKENSFSLKEALNNYYAENSHLVLRRVFEDKFKTALHTNSYQEVSLKLPPEITAIEKEPSAAASASEALGLKPDSDPLVTLNTLWNPVESEGEAPQKILIYGESGIGKSTWAYTVAHKVSSGVLWRSQFDIAFYIPIGRLQSYLSQKSKETEVSAFTFSDLFRYLYKINCSNDSFINLKNTKDILWVLDGIDDLNYTNIPDKFKKFIDELLSQKTILFTSQSNTFGSLEADIDEGAPFIYKDKTFCLSGLGDDAQFEFAKAYFNHQPKQSNKKSPRPMAGSAETKKSDALGSDFSRFIEYLNTVFWRHKRFKELAKNPMLLEMFCYISYCDLNLAHKPSLKAGAVINNSGITAVYSRAIKCYVDRWLGKTPVENNGTRLISGGLKKRKRRDEEVPLIESFLSKLAEKTFDKGMVISADSLMAIYGEFTKETGGNAELLNTVLTDFGLIQAVTLEKNILERNWRFVHPSFHEYYLAKALSQKITTQPESDEIKAWFFDHLFNERYWSVIEYLCGLHKNKHQIVNAITNCGLDLNQIIGSEGLQSQPTSLSVSGRSSKSGNILTQFLSYQRVEAAQIIKQCGVVSELESELEAEKLTPSQATPRKKIKARRAALTLAAVPAGSPALRRSASAPS